MQLYKKALKKWKDKNFLSAMNLLERSLKEENLSPELSFQVCQKIEEIHSYTNTSISTDRLKTLAHKYEVNNYFHKALNSLSQLYQLTGKKYLLKKQCLLHLKATGEVAKGTDLSIQYLSFLEEEKLSDSILIFISEIENSFPAQRFSKDNFFMSWRVKAYIIQGNIEKIFSCCNVAPITSLLFRKDYYSLELIVKHSNLSFNLLKNLAEGTKFNNLSSLKICKFLIDFILYQNKATFPIKEILAIATKYELNLISKEVSEILGYHAINQNNPSSRYIDHSIKIDLGSDLLGNTSHNFSGDQERRELDIKFLISIGKYDKAMEKILKLKDLYECKEIYEKYIKILNDKNYLEVDFHADKQNAYAEIKKDENLQDELLIAALKYHDNELLPRLESLIYFFCQSGLLENAKELLERKDKNISIYHKLNLQYIILEFSISRGEFSFSRDWLDTIINSTDLSFDKKILFSYLKAEIFYLSQYWDKALIIYQEISRNFPEYRLTKKRVFEIEERQ